MPATDPKKKNGKERAKDVAKKARGLGSASSTNVTSKCAGRSTPGYTPSKPVDQRYHPTMSPAELSEHRVELDKFADALHDLIKTKWEEGHDEITQHNLRKIPLLKDIELPYPLNTEPTNAPQMHCRGPCLSLVKDLKTGKIYATQNQVARPETPAPLIAKRIDDKIVSNQEKIAYSDKTSPQARGGMIPMIGYPGTHSEVHGVNQALLDRQAAGIDSNDDDLEELRTMIIHNTRTESGVKDGTRMTRCVNCRDVTLGAQAIYDAPC